MTRVSTSMRSNVCNEAARFLAEHGFAKPPLAPDQALEARRLEVTQLSLDDLLVKANLPETDHKKIQAMLNTRERAVTFRSGLPAQQKNWGSLHEIGHEFLPWQREYLFYCSLIRLPAAIQKEFELEADIFAAEAFFFGDRFRKYMTQGGRGLVTAIDLADNVFGTSLHATFRHYVENSEESCCLLVWRPAEKDSHLWAPGCNGMSIHYYIPSPTFRLHFDPGQVVDSDDVITKVFSDRPNEVVKHTMDFNGTNGEALIAEAESFSNGYTVFTLISQPQPLARIVSIVAKI